MQHRIAWKSVACALLVGVALAAPASAALSVIDDEPDPIGNTVQVVVGSDYTKARQADVEFHVILQGGKSAVLTRSVTVPAGGSVSVSGTFERPVASVTHVGIIEGPDPIP